MARAVRLTGAAVAAFAVAQVLFPSTVPILAPLTALLVVEVTLKDIVTSGVQRVASVTAGVLLAVAFSSIVGLTWWSLGVLVAVSILVGQLLRLGPHLLEVPISAMLVLAVGRCGSGRRRPHQRDPDRRRRRCRRQPALPARGPCRHRRRGRAPVRRASCPGLLPDAAAELRDPITQQQADRWMDDARVAEPATSRRSTRPSTRRRTAGG